MKMGKFIQIGFLVIVLWSVVVSSQTQKQVVRRLAYAVRSMAPETSDQYNVPYGITQYGSNYYTIWNNSLIYSRPVVNFSTVFPAPATGVITSVISSGTTPAAPWSLSTLNGNILLLVSASSGETRYYVNPTTLALTEELELTSFNSQFSGGACADSDGSEAYISYDAVQGFLLKRADGNPPKQAPSNCTLIGHETASIFSHTRIYCNSNIAALTGESWVMMDVYSPGGPVFRAYNSTCNQTSCSAVHEWALANNSTLGGVSDTGFIGVTVDPYTNVALYWIWDYVNKIYYGYDLSYGSELKTATTANSIPLKNWLATTNASYCYNNFVWNPIYTGYPTGLSANFNLLNITYEDVIDMPPSYLTGFMGCNYNNVTLTYHLRISRYWNITNAMGVTSRYQQYIAVKGFTVPNSTDPNNRYLSISQWGPSIQQCSSNWTVPFVVDCWAELNTTQYLGWVNKSDALVTLLPYGTCTPANQTIAIVNRTYGGSGCGGFQAFAPGTSQLVALIDNIPPILSYSNYTWNTCVLPSTPINAACSDNCTYCNCTITFFDSIYTNGLPDCSGGIARVINRTLIATDSCGNQAIEYQFITVIDTTAPSISIRNATCACSVESDCFCGVSFSDDCGMPSTGDTLAAKNSCTFTWNAYDYCANEAVAVQSLIVGE